MKNTIVLLAALFSCTLASARITLPSILGDGMVLQRDATVQVWGFSDRAKVKVVTSWDGKKYSVKPDDAGNWSVQVSTPVPGGGPYSITISDGDKLVLRDVYVGEV